ncbi:hypothetical protein ACDL92_12015 [Ihubacter sp. mB4P-1]|uniref:hypothetical protein n=1 Tax=Ihubacter sp. mB4P-1 TaxID=3242370 RepID=UPI003C7B831A
MKKSRAEMIQMKIDKAQGKLEKNQEQGKELRKEIIQLKKEKEDAEMEELHSYMKEYDITPARARGFMEQMQEHLWKEEADEKGQDSDSSDADSI